jgi:hypothetical protein
MTRLRLRRLAATAARLIATAALVCAPGAQAAQTVALGLSLDANDITPNLNFNTGGAGGTPPFNPFSRVDLAVGDTLTLTLDFAGAQTLTLDSATQIWLSLFTTNPSQVVGTGSLTLLDVNGAAIETSVTKTTTEGLNHFGQSFSNLDFSSGLVGLTTLGGLRYSGMVVGYAEPGLTSRSYDTPSLVFNANGYSVGAVPEPSSGMLSLLALGAMAACSAVKRQQLRVR